MSFLTKQYIPKHMKLTLNVFAMQPDVGKEEFWFEGGKIANYLGFEEPFSAIMKHVPREYRKSLGELRKQRPLNAPPAAMPHDFFILEPGVFFLAAASKNQIHAGQFTKWIHEELVPPLRIQLMNSYFMESRKDEYINKEGWIYLAVTPNSLENNIYKLGQTGNLKKRLLNLNDNCLTHEEFQFIGVWECAERESMEKELYRFLEKYHFEKRFFKFDTEEMALSIVGETIRTISTGLV